MRGFYVNSINGLYHSDSDLISEQCLGPWIVPVIDEIGETITKTIEDPSSLHVNVAKNTAFSVIDLIYKNIDIC
jgi:hypothetical protein